MFGISKMFSVADVKYEYVVLPAFGPVPRGRPDPRDDVLEGLRDYLGRLGKELAPRSMYTAHHDRIDRPATVKRRRAALRAELKAYQALYLTCLKARELEELPEPITAKEAVYLTRTLRAWLAIPPFHHPGHNAAVQRHTAAVNKLIAVFNQHQEEIDRFAAACEARWAVNK